MSYCGHRNQVGADGDGLAGVCQIVIAEEQILYCAKTATVGPKNVSRTSSAVAGEPWASSRSMPGVSVGDQSSRLVERRSITGPNHIASERIQAPRAVRQDCRAVSKNAALGAPH